MYLSRVQIRNLRNFKSVDVKLSTNVVLVGENQSGKSNFLFALRLVLDTNMPDRVRQLRLSDVFDGYDWSTAPEIWVELDFTDFDSDPNLIALLTDFRIAEDHKIARLSYVWRRKAGIEGPIKSDADFEFKIFGGSDETRSIRNDVRRRISLDLLNALRDAESELGSWRTSPLRPLLEDAVSNVQKDKLDEIGRSLSAATNSLSSLDAVQALETSIRAQIGGLSGAAQDIKAKLGFAPSDPLRIFRSISMFIDDGKRSLSDASLGSANLALLALKLAEFAWRRAKNERNHTILCVEEPEAHLHPQLQRRIFNRLFKEDLDPSRTLMLTTHSPNIASVVSLKSIVVLRRSSEGTKAHALAHLSLAEPDLEDLQRYLTTSRADILFSRAVIFVEGDAEEALIPAFSEACGYNLDELGIAVCNVGGVNFLPYVKLAAALKLPFAVVTDWDPLDGTKQPLGKVRALNVADVVRMSRGQPPLMPEQRANALASDVNEFKRQASKAGVFLNSTTLELEIAQSPALLALLLEVFEAENFGTLRQRRIAEWKKDASTVNSEQLMAMVGAIGKGRLSGRLAPKLGNVSPPAYIKNAIDFVVANAQS